ncbi:hypothetical protein [Acidipila rosea]|uniref:VWFA-related protein n=1 Tax=Acidipila rosea TaxID=768535 RepID=A0A4R1LAW2_9BACT|nr:hypothetical protein [Acidipila rosea]TCK74053.1 hypothetical protein C7378_1673 [Acidipila rosea]
MRATLSTLVAGLLLLQPLHAQTAGEPPPTLKIAVHRVELPVTVLNRKTGKPLTSLTAQDFRILDGDTPVPITYFRAPDHAQPLTVYLLFRNDAIDQKPLAKIAQQMPGAFKSLPTDAQIAVASYSASNVSLWLSPQSDRAAALAAIRNLVTANPDEPKKKQKTGRLSTQQIVAQTQTAPLQADPVAPQPVDQTNLTGGQQFKHMMATYDFGSSGGLHMIESDWKKHGNPDTRPVVVLISDELSMCYVWMATRLHNAMLRDGFTVEVLEEPHGGFSRAMVDVTKVLAPNGISLDPENAMFRYRYETYIAKATGGEVIAVSKRGYQSGFEQIFTDIASAYQLEFAPPPTDKDGKLHRIHVELVAHPGFDPSAYDIRARDHYFAGGLPAPEPSEIAPPAASH